MLKSCDDSQASNQTWYKVSESPFEVLFKKALKLGFEIIAPSNTTDKETLLLPVGSYEEVNLNFIRTRNTPKSYLLPNKEILLRFDFRSMNLKEEVPIPKKLMFFGIHPCDANAIDVMDKVLLDPPEDPFYSTRRSSSAIVVIDCCRADEYCFCESVNSRVPRVYDLWIVPVNDSELYISIGSPLGKSMVKELKLRRVEPPKVKRLNYKLYSIAWEKLRDLYDSTLWERLSERCLLCGACLSACPTCTCFDLVDELSPNLNECIRMRVWDSCIFRTFTWLAGGKIVRRTPQERFKFRFFHKFLFIRERYGVFGCVGCGRCVSSCSSHIHPLDVLSEVLKHA